MALIDPTPATPLFPPFDPANPGAYRPPVPTESSPGGPNAAPSPPPSLGGDTILNGGTTQPNTSGGGGDLQSRINQALTNAGSTDDPNYWYGKISADPNGATSAWDYWVGRINQGNGAAAVRNGTTPLFNDGPSGPPTTTNTNVFSDPATTQYEGLINDLINKLNTPYQPPGYQNTLDSLNQYVSRLQGPAYTPAQMDLMQTQAQDPLMSSRDAARQQIIQHFGAQGIPPSSGIVQSALQQSDQQFEKLNTQQQAGFAQNAIGMQNQNQATAAQLQAQILAMEQGNYNYNLGNQATGVQDASIIPNLAWSRLTGANQTIAPTTASDPALLQLLQSFQGQGYNQSQNYTNALLQILAGL